MRKPLLALTLTVLLASPSPAAADTGAEILRDRWGIPHVFADTDAGAFYGLGYATAEDRAFQMTYSLRIIQGRLSEVIGEVRQSNRNQTSVDHDREMRTFGFHRAARRTAAALDPETRGLLQAYCDGVNACFREHGDDLHPLFAQLGLEPEPWTPADCLASWWHLAQFFATDGTRDLIAGRGDRGRTPAGGEPVTPPAPDAAVNPAPLPPDDAPAVVKRSDVSPEWIERVFQYAREHGLEGADAFGGEGPRFSHAWVLGAKRTTTGSAVLVSDPQTPVRNPSLLYQFHFQGRTFNARGVGVAGSPVLLVGFTDKVAWGVTALGADQADLFQLDTDPARPDQYRFDGEWRPLTVHRETLRVKGSEALEMTVRETHLGPLATAFCFAAPGEPEVALKRIPICETDRETIQGALAMMRAGNVHELDAALAGWRFPSANMVFGDRAGNIGYRVVGALPIRSRHDPTQGRAARPGQRSDQDWQGIRPHDLAPGVINPAAGLFYSANHRPVESWYPLPLGAVTGLTGDTLRSWRLRERLEAKAAFTPEEVLEIHGDAVNPARRDIVRLGLHLRDTLRRDLPVEARRALEHLEPWYRAGASTALTEAGAELALELDILFRRTDLARIYGGGESGLAYFLKTVGARLDRDPRAGLSQAEQDFVERSLSAAWQSAQQKHGLDPAAWNSRAREAVQQRPLGYYESLDGFPALDPSRALTLPALTRVDTGVIGCQTDQAYTQWVPLHDPDLALALLPIGQSELPGHASRTSTLELWGESRLHPAPLSRAAVERLATAPARRLETRQAGPPGGADEDQPGANTPGPAPAPPLPQKPPEARAQPEVWLCAGDRIMDLLEPGAEWPFGRQHLAGIKLYVGQLSGNPRRTAEEAVERLRPLVRLIRTHNLQVAVELGGCLDFSPLDDTAGEWSARHELAALANFYAAGGGVDFLDLDGPIRRLLHPENRPDGRRFDSVDKAADQLVEALELHRATHPETKYWLLTNFPNWGWRGDVSYHARGPHRQDYGDCDGVVRIVLQKLRAAGIPLDGVTVDNPYDYLMGEHFSVNLPDPKAVDWLARVRSYEDFAREQGLTFNLIVNSQRGGQESDERFFGETLRMVDTYQRTGGRPTRWFVQSWYPHPKQMLPETAPHSMTALVKAVIERVRGEAPGREARAPLRAGPEPAGRILLRPEQGRMMAVAQAPHLGGQSFALGIPETIGAREKMILNFPEVEGRLTWTEPAEDGSIASQWTQEAVVQYHLRLVPGDDTVDIEMTITNLGGETWHDVFAFNCLNPAGAPAFRDWTLERTFMSSRGEPLLMAGTQRVQGHMPTVGFYTHEQTPWGRESAFVRGFSATSPDRTDDSWIVTVSEDGRSHMAATSPDAPFLFNNLDRCCIHSATGFGDIGPGETSSTVARLYLAEGGLDEFLARFQAERGAFEARQHRARPRRPRLEVEGLPPPEAGRLGVLGFRIRAPWMQGVIEQRFPETIHSSLGLHFIDHRRPDMPPLSMLEPFPAWDVDEATGGISYTHRDRSGLVFSGRARPYEDEVVLEYRIRNETGAVLRNVSVQMCTNLGPSPDFDPKDDVTRTFTWVGGRWTTWADTTPDPARVGRHPWILMQVQGSDYPGPRENPDGWWVADQVADHGIAARVTRDGAHLAAVRWDGAPMIMSNSRIPCLHAGPAAGVSLDPGHEVVWRGTIYLMENDPEQLRRRHLAARGNVEPSDRQPPTTERSSPADRSAPPVRQARGPADVPAAGQHADGPFQIVRSFPVSEATWAAKVGELYLVAAQRSLLVYRKTGPAVSEYREVNRIFPGVDGRIENCVVTADRLYLPASAQGLLAYRLADLEQPGVQPVARYPGPRRIGAISAAGNRIYAAYAAGGIGVFDAETLTLLGEGLLEGGTGALGLTALAADYLYTTRAPDYKTLLVIDARDPVHLQVVQRVANVDYATMFRFPFSVVGSQMYCAEHNGGVGVYDITVPAAPRLVYRYGDIGPIPPRGPRNRPGLVRACAVTRAAGLIAVDQTVRSLRFADGRLCEGGTVMTADLEGNGLLNPTGIFVRDGVAAILTTMEGVRFYDVRNDDTPEELLRIDLPSRIEGLAKVGRMVYATADVDGVWQVDWDAEGRPRVARRIPLKGLSEDLALHGLHVYVANGVGLAVIDISDENQPREVHYWDFPYRDGKPDIQQGWVEGVDVDGDTLYAALGPAGMATFDVSNPAHPVLLATIVPGTWGNEVVVDPGRKLLAFTGQEKFALVDVSDPQHPSVLSNTPVEAGKGTMGSAFSPDGGYLVVCQRGRFSVYDVREPGTPRFLKSYDGCGSENALFFRGFLLVSGRGAGIGVWRVGATPADLVREQTLPCYFYNSKFFVDGDSVFTNSEGIDELRLSGLVREPDGGAGTQSKDQTGSGR